MSDFAQLALTLDQSDPLRTFRNEFYLPHGKNGAPWTYFCGHSLGLQPKITQAFIDEALTAWRTSGVEGHFTGKRPWLSYHEHAASGLAALTGARESEVVAMNSLSMNLHLLLTSFYRPTPERYKVLIEASAFPSDRYAVLSHLQLHGLDPRTALIEIAPREGETTINESDIHERIARDGSEIATVFLPGVQYLSGQRFDIRALSHSARSKGCVVGFDLAHAIGNVPLSLHDDEVDFAVWCSYKYLNSGPGAVGGAFVHERHARNFALPRLAGWWGHNKSTRFAMPPDFEPLVGAEGWQVSNPPIFATAPLLASLDIFSRATLPQLRAKSVALTNFLERALREKLTQQITILTPTASDARGCQLSLRLNTSRDRAQSIHRQLQAAGFICDWREPNVIRVAPVPLYNTYTEAWSLTKALTELIGG